MARPLGRHRAIASISVSLLLAAFVLLLLVAISLPIIKPIYILALQSTIQVQHTTVATELRFGVWGVCAANTVGNQATAVANCFGPQLGYQVPPSLASLIGITPEVTSILTKVLLVLLILHPIAAGLSLLSLFFSLFMASHLVSVLALLLAVLSGIASTIVFAADLALVIIARSKVKNLTEGQFTVVFGNAVWMVLAAMVVTWFASVVLSARACYCCGVKKRHQEDDDYYNPYGYANSGGYVSTGYRY
ncbi:hypothetical protein AMATHDRAFT_74453 [Amanita thiersii Skay4041]|uniref:Pali-domain-containing protein n=1 Tax=Amanita thiersii Skay4041 TaxID=703135 RepID=A0A2A9NWS8_9AGAR|nr:hypothetical protein AMATHDRAFT_74453 [Amanita thiersii Skay4041]